MFNHVFVEFNLYYSDGGIIYNAIANIIESLLNNYNLVFFENYFFRLFVNVVFCFSLITILFYVFNIKFKYIKKLKFIEIIISVIYKQIFRIIAFSLSGLKRKSQKARTSQKSYKSEPVLHKNKNSFIRKINKENKIQSSEFDNYIYQLPSTELFARSSVKYSQTKELQ